MPEDEARLRPCPAGPQLPSTAAQIPKAPGIATGMPAGERRPRQVLDVGLAKAGGRLDKNHDATLTPRAVALDFVA